MFFRHLCAVAVLAALLFTSGCCCRKRCCPAPACCGKRGCSDVVVSGYEGSCCGDVGTISTSKLSPIPASNR